MSAGYVVLTRKAGSDDPWEVEHVGEPWERHEAIREAETWCRYNPGHQWAIARLVIDGPATVVRPGTLGDQGTLT